MVVIGLPILEVVATASGLSSCSGAGFMDVGVIAVTLGLAAGGVLTLVLAARGGHDSPQRTTARRLGIVALVMAGLSLPLNVLLVGLSGFCLEG
jgi:hypothetical protein